MTKELIFELWLRREISKNPYCPDYGNRPKFNSPIFRRRYRALLRQHYMLELSYLRASLRALFRERNYAQAFCEIESFISARMSREARLRCRRTLATRLMVAWLFRVYDRKYGKSI